MMTASIPTASGSASTPLGPDFCWLLDASALTPAEQAHLRQAPRMRCLYDDLADAQAASVGPVLAAPCAATDRLAEQLRQEEKRAWAVSAVDSASGFDAVVRHFMALRHLYTKDRQRYYLRYADSRCLAALWPVLTGRQQGMLMGPVQQWIYTDRCGQLQALALDDEAASRAQAEALTGPLNLTDLQLGALLQRSWPDQLLYSVAETTPDAGQGLSAAERHACARRVCDWLLTQQEERYPVQLAVMTRILGDVPPRSAQCAPWDEAQWAAALLASHQAGIDACA